MNSPFFEAVNLKPLAVAGEHVAGEVSLARLPRVRGLLGHDAGTIRAAFRFSLRSDGRVLIRSQLEGELPLTCQRCLGELALPFESDSSLLAVASEAAAATLDDTEFEPVISADGSVVLADIIEEELLLALPIAPKHSDAAQCAGVVKEFVVRDQPEKKAPQTHHPFKNLKDILH